jgi:hypothetical protein
VNSLLPTPRDTGSLVLIETYEFYDGPKLFACRNAIGQIYFGLWVGSDRESENYWLVPASQERLEFLRSGGLDLATAFADPELGFLYLCKVTPSNGSTETTALLAEQLDRNLFPEAGERLNLPTETLRTRVAERSLADRAAARHREALSIHLDLSAKREEAPTKELGRILVSFQETLDALGQKVDGQPTLRGAISPEILSKTQTCIVQAVGGSFALEISAAQESDLFGNSLISEALMKFFDIIEIGDDAVRLRESLIEMRPRAASKYRIFLASLLQTQAALRAELASSRDGSTRWVSLDLKKTAAALKTAEEVTRENGEIREGLGVLIGIELPRKTFTAVLFEDEDTIYRGKLLEQAFSSAQHATLNHAYKLKIRETIAVSSAAEERLIYELESIDEVAVTEGSEDPNS